MPKKLETTKNTAKLKSSPQKTGDIKNDGQKPIFGVKGKANPTSEAEKAIARKVSSDHSDEKKHHDHLGRKPCPDGMTWDNDLNKCV